MNIITRLKLARALKERIERCNGYMIRVNNPNLPEYVGMFRHHTYTFFHVGEWRNYERLIAMGYFVVNISSSKQLDKTFSRIEEKLGKHDEEQLYITR